MAGCASNDDPPKAKPTPKPKARTEITLAVYGPTAVTDAYKRLGRRLHRPASSGVKVDVKVYPTHDVALDAVRAPTEEGNAPDLFLMDHDDLAALTRGEGHTPRRRPARRAGDRLR